jgi:hypothetical protein
MVRNFSVSATLLDNRGGGMNLLEWFLAGGIWMWPILLMVVAGLPIAVLALLLLRAEKQPMLVFRRATGVVLLLVAVFCLAAGVAGHSQAKRMLQAQATERNITDPEFLRVGNREARVPLEASVPPALVLAIVGIFALRKSPGTDP